MNGTLRVLLGIGMAGLLGMAVPAAASPAVYESPADDGADPHAPVVVPIGGQRILHLYVSLGEGETSSGTPCRDGDGDEICGIDVHVRAHGSFVLVDFVPDGDVVWRLTPTGLRVNRLDAETGALGPIKLGSLTVAANGEEGVVRVEGTHVVDATLQLRDVVPNRLAITSDNCPGVSNPEQADADGNGVGDECQCGDVTGDGITNVTDALAIARGEVLSSDPSFGKCDVNGDGACNVTDALKIARGEAGSDPASQLCPAYRGE